MKKEEKKELLEKDVDEIKDNEIDDYIKKYIKLRHVNRAKLAALTLVPVIALGTIGGVIAGVGIDASNPYSSIRTYNVQYVDADTSKIIEENIKKPYAEYNTVTVKYPYEKIKDSYVRKTTTYLTEDDISDKVNDIINAYPENIEYIIDVYDKYDNFEVKTDIKSEDNSYQISVVYNDYIGESKIDKTTEDSFIDQFVILTGTLMGTIPGIVIKLCTANKQISIENKINDINSKILSLKSRKRFRKKNEEDS